MTYALVTGASAGMGALFAEALAAEGRALVLVARRVDRLETLAIKLRMEHGVGVEIIGCDLAEPGAAGQLVATLRQRGLAIDTLVNNAGFGAQGAFATMDAGTIEHMIAVNMTALTGLARALLPDMIAARRGTILNVASAGAFVPGPWFAVYFATKAYVLSLSEALHEELRGSGVSVIALCPGPVHTEFATVAGMTDTAAFDRVAEDPRDVVRQGMAALAKGHAVRVTGLARYAVPLLGLVPRGLKRRVIGGAQAKRRGDEKD